MRRPTRLALQAAAGIILAGAFVLAPQAGLQATTVPPPKCDPAHVAPLLGAALVSYDAYGGYGATISVTFKSPVHPSLCKNPTEVSVKRFADGASDPEFELAHLDPASLRKIDDPAEVRANGAPNAPGLVIHHSYTYQVCGFYAGAPEPKCNQTAIWIPLAPPAAPKVITVCSLPDRHCVGTAPATAGSQGTTPMPPGGTRQPSSQPASPSGPSQGPPSGPPSTRTQVAGFEIDWVPADSLASGFAIARFVSSWTWIAVINGAHQHSFVDTGDQPWLGSGEPIHTYRVCALSEGWYHSPHDTLFSFILLPPTRSPQTKIVRDDLTSACSAGLSVGPSSPVRKGPGG